MHIHARSVGGQSGVMQSEVLQKHLSRRASLNKRFRTLLTNFKRFQVSPSMFERSQASSGVFECFRSFSIVFECLQACSSVFERELLSVFEHLRASFGVFDSFSNISEILRASSRIFGRGSEACRKPAGVLKLAESWQWFQSLLKASRDSEAC